MGEESVRRVYDENPFPRRDPSDEAKRLVKTDYGNLRIVNSIFWGGNRALEGLRVLDAGCGTGDAVIFMAEQLRGTGSEIIAFDISQRSLDIVRERADSRKLGDIRYVCGSLSGIASMNLGEFDYIVCTSVLPHLEDPEGGLKALAGMLKPDGGMLIKVYGRYGRFGINIVQQIVRIINGGQEDFHRKQELARRIVECLPAGHPFRGMKDYGEGKYDFSIEGHTARQFSVPELYSFARSAGLEIAAFMDGPIYAPERYCRGRLGELDSLSPEDGRAVAELMNATMNRHGVYLSRRPLPPMSPVDEDSVPQFKDCEAKPPPAPVGGTKVVFQGRRYNKPVEIDGPKAAIFGLIDGKRSLREILDAASDTAGRPRQEMMAAWLEIYAASDGSHYILLNRPRKA